MSDKLNTLEALRLASLKAKGYTAEQIAELSSAMEDIIKDINDSLKTCEAHVQSAHAPANAEENVIVSIQRNGQAIPPDNKVVNIEVPTKTSALENDSGYATTEDVEEKVNGAGHLKAVPVDALPAPSEANADTIYFLRKNNSEAGKQYRAYKLIHGIFEVVGSAEVDLTGYVQQETVEKADDSIIKSIYSSMISPAEKYLGSGNLLLSALTNIPQTILFGRSPAGMNATGDSDFESYYNFVEKIQRLMLKRNLRTLLDVVFRAGIASGDVAEEPDYKLEFKPLWSLSDTEQAAVDQTKAQTALVKAQTAQAYVDMQALDPTEVRRRLASDEEFDVEDIISEDDEDDLLQSLLGTEPSAMSDVEAAQKNIEQGQAPGGEEQSATVAPTATPPTTNADATDTDYGVGVLVVQDGRFLCGTRLKGGSVGGPGGHIEAGESPEDAAIRETQEEFGITPKDLMPVAFLSDLKPPYCPSHVFLCTDFDGSIRCADGEMASPGFITAEKVAELSTQNPERLFPPFAQSIAALLDVLSSNPGLTSDAQNAKMKDRMDFNEADHPRDENGQFAEGEGSSSGSTESGPAVSPEGENVPCTGFASPTRLEDHATRHGLAEMGFATKEEYQQKGIDFLKQPCGGDVIGYARPDGVVVRFNTKTTEYATGVPGGPLKTYMKAKCNRKTGEARPEVAMKYYEFNREKDLKEEDDEQGS